MTLTGHTAFGLATGLTAAALFYQAGIAPLWWAGPLMVAGTLGGMAPDRIEWLPYVGHRWLKHRTWTHWWLPWAFVLMVPPLFPAAQEPFVAALALTFFAGVVSHILGDLPNPSGVPLIHPHQRISLNWWRSGQHEWWLIPLIFVVPICLWCGEFETLANQVRSGLPVSVQGYLLKLKTG